MRSTVWIPFRSPLHSRPFAARCACVGASLRGAARGQQLCPLARRGADGLPEMEQALHGLIALRFGGLLQAVEVLHDLHEKRNARRLRAGPLVEGIATVRIRAQNLNVQRAGLAGAFAHPVRARHAFGIVDAHQVS
jgi:hypothetical protein